MTGKSSFSLAEEKLIVDQYVTEMRTLRQIADGLDSNHHSVKRVLLRNGIEITRAGRKRAPFTDEHRKRLSESSKGRKPWSAGKEMPESLRRTNMRVKMGTDIDLEKYPTYERLLFLTRLLSKRKAHLGGSDRAREEFLDRFYFDPQFNAIYDAWIVSGQNRWYRPTLDHKKAQANGGGWGIDNLQFLTWFENRAKADMDEIDWLAFCAKTGTASSLFIRVSP